MLKCAHYQSGPPGTLDKQNYTVHKRKYLHSTLLDTHPPTIRCTWTCELQWTIIQQRAGSRQQTNSTQVQREHQLYSIYPQECNTSIHTHVSGIGTTGALGAGVPMKFSRNHNLQFLEQLRSTLWCNSCVPCFWEPFKFATNILFYAIGIVAIFVDSMHRTPC